MLNKKIIRNLIVNKIKGHSAFAGLNITNGRRVPVSDNKLPACFIFTEEESSVRFGASPRMSSRELEIVIEYIVKGRVSETEDMLDDFAFELENIMNFDPLLTVDDTAVLEESQIMSSEKDISHVSATPILSVSIMYRLEYITKDISNLNTVNDFNGFDGKIGYFGKNGPEVENDFPAT
jgi:hypothetical protein